MMPESIGTMGSTQGVNDNNRPKPKKLRISSQVSPWNSAAIAPSSPCASGADVDGAPNRRDTAGSPPAVVAARRSSAFCSTGT